MSDLCRGRARVRGLCAGWAKPLVTRLPEGWRQTDDYRDYYRELGPRRPAALAAAHLILENLDGSEDDLSRVDDSGRELHPRGALYRPGVYHARSEVVEATTRIRRWDLKTLVTGAIKANARELIAAVAPGARTSTLEVFTDEKVARVYSGPAHSEQH